MWLQHNSDLADTMVSEHPKQVNGNTQVIKQFVSSRTNTWSWWLSIICWVWVSA